MELRLANVEKLLAEAEPAGGFDGGDDAPLLDSGDAPIPYKA
jgi:hypothetical protein